MGLFGKKKEEKAMLPDLPETNADLPRLPEYGSNAVLNSDMPQGNGEMMPMNDGQQNAIKNEIHSNSMPADNNEMQKSSFGTLPSYPSGGMPAKIVAEPSYVMQEHHESNDVHEPRTFEMSPNSVAPSNVKKAQPIYIRLDKFKAGLESFDDIKGKLTEIEDLLVKIREMKDKEERELEEWEREIQVVKARIEQIDNDVFRNVE